MRMLFLTALVLAACRPDPGAPDYPDPPVLLPTQTNPDFLGGDVAYDPDVPRASLSVFYEGSASDEYAIDDLSRFYFIWDDTFTQIPDDFRIEGLLSDRLEISDVGWWGGGISWDQPTDLSEWDTLHVCVASTSVAVLDFDLLMGDASGAEARVAVGDYGYTPNGSWHCMGVPLTSFAPVDLTQVTAPFALVGETGTVGDSVFIDDLYLTVTP